MDGSSAGKVFGWDELPQTKLFNGSMTRTAFRSDGAFIMFDWAIPGMERWEPHEHPFDQTVLTVEGRQLLEIDGEAMEMGAGTIARIPSNVPHTGWLIGDRPLMNIDIFAPPRADYLHLVDYQDEYRAANAEAKKTARKYVQAPMQKPFSGKFMTDTSGTLFRWRDLPTVDVAPGMKRSAFRAEACLLSFNWIEPGFKRLEPHRHPFDQVVMTVEGTQVVEVDGKPIECGPRTILRIPANVPHTGWVEGGEHVLNIDVFAPPRPDYLYLTKYQQDF